MVKWRAAFLLLTVAAAATAAPLTVAVRALPPLPPLPSLPPFPFPVIPVAAPPASCADPLLAVTSCAQYLTNLTITTPLQKCCDGLASILSNSSRICLCHVLRSDINKYTGAAAPINLTRVLLLPAACGTVPPIETLYMCFLEAVPPIGIEAPHTSPAPVPPSLPAPTHPALTQPRARRKMRGG